MSNLWVCWDRGSFLMEGGSYTGVGEAKEEDEEEPCWRVRPCTRWGQTLAYLPLESSGQPLTSSFLLYGGRDGRFSVNYIYPPEVWTCSLLLPQLEGSLSSHAPSDSSSFEWRCGPLVPHSTAHGVAVPVTPPARFLHTMVTVGRTALVWGGHDDNEVFDDLYLLDIDTMSWSKLELEGEPPGPRCAAAGVALDDGSALSYGGRGNDGEVFNDLHQLHVSSDKRKARWTKLHPQGGQPPKPRDGCTASLVKGKLYVIGGSEEEREVFVYDIEANEWHSISPPAEDPVWPTLRCGHACAVVSDRYIVMFGGCTSDALAGDTYGASIFSVVAVVILHPHKIVDV